MLVHADRACLDLAKLRHLRQLNLGQNRGVTDVGVNLLANRLGGVLESINLSYTSVSDACIAMLAGMQVGGWVAAGTRLSRFWHACSVVMS